MQLMTSSRTVIKTIREFMGSPLARRLAIGLFILQAVLLVFMVRIGTPPDETNHIKFIEFYANHSISPIFDHQQPTYNLGDKTREVDYLYHYGMSLVERVLPFSPNVEQHIIRTFSVVFAVMTLIVFAKLMRRIGVGDGAITGAILLVTNLPMVLMLSSAINNDVLVWLGASLGLLLAVRLWQKPTLLDLLWLINLSIAGGLVKRTFLPLGMAFGVFALLILLKHRRTLLSGIHWRNMQIILALVVLLASVVMFSERVGGNIVRYGHIVASCDEVQGETACYNFWDNARTRYLATLPPEAHIPLGKFVVKWFGDSFANIVDIQTQGWRHEVKPARWLTPSLVTLFFMGVLYGLFSDGRLLLKDKQAQLRLAIVALCVFYVFVQLAVNLGNYKKYQVFGIALNGRYILPGLIPLVGLVWFYWSKMLRRYPGLQLLLALAIVGFTILGSGLLMMLNNSQLRLG